MARITVEDCKITEDRFELVNLAAERAKAIESGAAVTVEKKNDKNTVIALREIAAKNIDLDALRNRLRKRLNPNLSIESIEDEIEQSVDSEEALGEDIEYINMRDETEADDSFYDDNVNYIDDFNITDEEEQD